MFSEADFFNQLLGKWNVSNVTDMSEMFRDAESFKQRLDSWDVSHVENSCGIFDTNELYPASWHINKDTSSEDCLRIEDEAEYEGLNAQTEDWEEVNAKKEYEKKQQTCHCNTKREMLPWMGYTNAEILTDM